MNMHTIRAVPTDFRKWQRLIVPSGVFLAAIGNLTLDLRSHSHTPALDPFLATIAAAYIAESWWLFSASCFVATNRGAYLVVFGRLYAGSWADLVEVTVIPREYGGTPIDALVFSRIRVRDMGYLGVTGRLMRAIATRAKGGLFFMLRTTLPLGQGWQSTPIAPVVRSKLGHRGLLSATRPVA